MQGRAEGVKLPQGESPSLLPQGSLDHEKVVGRELGSPCLGKGKDEGSREKQASSSFPKV